MAAKRKVGGAGFFQKGEIINMSVGCVCATYAEKG